MIRDTIINVYFSEKDNTSVSVEKDHGWIDDFVLLLKKLVKNITEEEPSVNLVASPDSLPITSHDLPMIHIFIFSEAFADDDACKQMTDRFTLMYDKGEINENCVFVRIDKGEVTLAKIPFFLVSVIEYDFYSVKDKVLDIKDIHAVEEVDDRIFWEDISELAYDVVNSCRYFGYLEKEDEIGIEQNIFLSEVPEFYNEKRNFLKRELINNGFIVFPNKPLPPDISLYYKSIQNYISQSGHAIHFLHPGKQDMIRGTNTGKEESQVMQTIQYKKNQDFLFGNSDLNIYIWLPGKPGEIKTNSLPEYISELQQMDEVNFIQSSFEEFKTYMLHILSDHEEMEHDSGLYIKGTQTIQLYFLFDKNDEEEAKEYIAHLRKRGFSVVTSLYDSDLIAVRKSHHENLRNFDIAIIFADKANMNWINMQILDVVKSPGFGRKKPVIGKVLLKTDHVHSVPLSFVHAFNTISGDKKACISALDKYLNDTLGVF